MTLFKWSAVAVATLVLSHPAPTDAQTVKHGDLIGEWVEIKHLCPPRAPGRERRFGPECGDPGTENRFKDIQFTATQQSDGTWRDERGRQHFVGFNDSLYGQGMFEKDSVPRGTFVWYYYPWQLTGDTVCVGITRLCKPPTSEDTGEVPWMLRVRLDGEQLLFFRLQDEKQEDPVFIWKRREPGKP